ncbi:MAG: hypothetical protein AAFQ82_08755 [Myxococcota bacterium]
MPCNDISEVLELTLDDADCLVDYRLRKRTCGAVVGAERLLIDWLGGLHVDTILATQSDALNERYGAEDDERAFLYFKHLFALRDGVKRILGLPGEHAVNLTHVEVDPSNGNLNASGIIEVGLLTEKIRSCGGCGTCRPRRLPIV